MFDADSSKLIASVSALALSLLITGVIRRRFAQSSRLPHPPGPKGLPFIGNLLQLLPHQLWESAVEWGKEYGDLIYLESLGKPTLIINSYELAKELLTRRSLIYSSRPQSSATKLECWDWVTVFVPYGETFRKHRSFQQRFVGSPECLDYMNIQLKATHVMLKAILDDPENYGEHVRSLPGSVILRNVYGHQVERNDRYVNIGKEGAYHATNSQKYMFLDAVPWLKYVPEWCPWVDFPRVIREAKKISHAMRYELYNLAKDKLAQGTLRECMTSIFLSENIREDGSIVDEEAFNGAAASLYMGGVDTTVTSVMTFILQMLKNPEVQRLAQLEIDEVVGSDRLPAFNDMQDMPYVRGVCAEVWRLTVVLPLIPAHQTTEDDEYEGYHIPAGTTVFANAWAMAFNPEYFPDPYEFKPERWLGEKVHGPHPTDFVFGFGRRICPGQDWAEKLLFIVVSSMLSVFNIQSSVGEDGKPIPPNENYSLGFLRQLGSSQCKITPRSLKAASLLENSVFAK